MATLTHSPDARPSASLTMPQLRQLLLSNFDRQRLLSLRLISFRAPKLLSGTCSDTPAGRGLRIEDPKMTPETTPKPPLGDRDRGVKTYRMLEGGELGPKVVLESLGF